MTVLETERLKLIALSREQLQHLHDDASALDDVLNLTIDGDVLTDVVRRAMRMKIERMSPQNAADHLWFTYWLMVIRREGERGVGAGLIGFKGVPQSIGRFDKLGEVEIGYGIAPTHSGQGYTTEAVRALIDWAFSHENCQAVIAARVLKTNLASQRILEKLGMTRYHQTQDGYFYRLPRPT